MAKDQNEVIRETMGKVSLIMAALGAIICLLLGLLAGRLNIIIELLEAAAK